ncbi:MAG: molybdenum cofactor biosynthesis protein MoaE [Polyangiaceae bacterium]|nr:molybdenum cofactor biosynthesis protein MoaE [Polyangiaceae bacterium]
MAHEHEHPHRHPEPAAHAAADPAALALLDLRADPVTLDEVMRAVEHPGAGAVATFVGIVRDQNEGRAVTRLDYEAYAPMAVRELRRIAGGIAAELPGTRLAALHRVGELGVGDVAIVCAASAPHRAEAFVACRALIDRIKADVPIWKREHGPEGAYWVGWRDARCTGDH